MVEEKPPSEQRLLSLDVYRGMIMVALAFGGFGLAKTAANHIVQAPGSWFWPAVEYQFSHVQWVGCAFWDLIQPSFMFMVGVSMAYSYGKREARGDSWGRMMGHVVYRSIVLILLGVFLSSSNSKTTNWVFMNVLSQIGLGYGFLFLFWKKATRVQFIGAAGLLAVTWLLYVLYTGSGMDLEKGVPRAGVTAEWAREHLAGIAPAWQKNANIGQAIDVRFLNWFPRSKPFAFNGGGYQTINFIPAIATMLFGLMCGELLRSTRPEGRKLKVLLVAGVLGLVLGQVMNLSGVCPMVKRIWTPSWAVFSAGWCCLFLGGLYYVIDIRRIRGWTFPLVVVGMNSIAMYFMGQLLKPWVGATVRTHFGQDIFKSLGALNEPFMQYTVTGLVFWLICWWMYRRRIFLRI